MKLSNKGRYGIRALFDIAFYNEGTATQIKDIADRQSIPPRFLEQIFQELKRSGLVVSKRGPKGGYQLSRGAELIRIGDVIRSLEGPVTLFGTDDEPSDAGGVSTTQTVTEEVFAELAAKVEASLDSVTLHDLCARAERQGVPRRTRQAYSYAI